MLRGKWILFAGLVVLIGALAGALTWYRRQARPAAPAAQTAAQQPLPPGAEVRINGVLRAVDVLKVPAPIDGVAEEFAVKPGDEVFEGQILGRIANDSLTENERESAGDLERVQSRLSGLESTLISARLEETRLEAELSRIRMEFQRNERAFQRQQALIREGATPRKTFEKAEQDYSASKAEIEGIENLASQSRDRVQKVISDIEAAKKLLAEKEEEHNRAKEELAASNVLSPVDGIVIAIRKSAGERVEKGLPDLVEIAVDLTQMEAVVEPDPRVLPRLRPGQAALIVLDDFPGGGLPATLKAIEEGRAIVEFASPSALIRPGANATVVFKLE